MAQEATENVIDQPEVLKPRMVTIEIAGKKYEVPEGITVIKAMWYVGQEVVRGVGCLGGAWPARQPCKTAWPSR
jgi:hypothetical protein